MSEDPGGGRRCAVLGSPVAHSRSPVLHRAAYAHLGLDWTYERVELEAPDLPAFLDGLDGSWRGLSLTMPLKEAALACVDTVDPLARDVRAVNTVVLGDDGARHGATTDVPGLVAALRERGAGPVHQAAVLGGGATARCAVAALATFTDRVVAAVRTPARVAELQRTAEAVGAVVDVRPWADRADLLAAPVVVATTPAGTVDDLATAVPDRPGVLLDVVYAPWPTALAAAWSAAGGARAGGLDLLVHQAVGQVRLMTGRDVPVDVLRAALDASRRA